MPSPQTDSTIIRTRRSSAADGSLPMCMVTRPRVNLRCHGLHLLLLGCAPSGRLFAPVVLLFSSPLVEVLVTADRMCRAARRLADVAEGGMRWGSAACGIASRDVRIRCRHESDPSNRLRIDRTGRHRVRFGSVRGWFKADGDGLGHGVSDLRATWWRGTRGWFRGSRRRHCRPGSGRSTRGRGH